MPMPPARRPDNGSFPPGEAAANAGRAPGSPGSRTLSPSVRPFPQRPHRFLHDLTGKLEQLRARLDRVAHEINIEISLHFSDRSVTIIAMLDPEGDEVGPLEFIWNAREGGCSDFPGNHRRCRE